MTRRTTQTFHGDDQPPVEITLPDDHQRPGVHTEDFHAWAVDNDTGDWSTICQYCVANGVHLFVGIHHDHLPPVVELTDDDGLVDPDVVVALPRSDT